MCIQLSNMATISTVMYPNTFKYSFRLRLFMLKHITYINVFIVNYIKGLALKPESPAVVFDLIGKINFT